MIRSVSRSPLCSVSLKERRNRGRGGLLLGEGGVHVSVERRCDFLGFADVELVFCNVAEYDHAGPMSEYPEPRAQVRRGGLLAQVHNPLSYSALDQLESLPRLREQPGQVCTGRHDECFFPQSVSTLTILGGRLHTMEKPNVSHQQRVLCCNMGARLRSDPRLEEGWLAAGGL